MVVKIEMDGKTIEGDTILPVINAMRDNDGRAIYDKVNEPATPQENKGGASSAPAPPVPPHRLRLHLQRLLPHLPL